jgi:hypothetical protein
MESTGGGYRDVAIPNRFFPEVFDARPMGLQPAKFWRLFWAWDGADGVDYLSISLTILGPALGWLLFLFDDQIW